ncbi:MAG: hypothetical protein R3330_02895, partial [Saprospiraceae bacterium]|nr:hypothetical protein [Saprospiraceae bacterium]
PWEPLTDNLPVLGISGIVVIPGTPDELFVLTGDGDGMTPFVSGSTQNYGAGDIPSIGVLTSADGGLTWDSTSLSFVSDTLVRAYKLIAYPGSVDTMFAATSEGLFRTDDGWTSPPDQVITSPVFDVEFHPADPQIIYAAGTSVLRRSTDGGVNFSNAGVGTFADVDPSQSCRMAIAVTPALPDALYVIMAKLDTRGMLSLQFSADQANSFIEFTDESYNVLCRDDPEDDPSGQGNYDLAIWADPDISARFIVGGIDLWLNAFGNWTKLVDDNDSPPTYTHADIHAIETNPFTGNLVVGTDGGIFHSEDGGYNWTNRGKGLGVTQFYHFDIHTDYLGFPTLGGGAQDNGTSFLNVGSGGLFDKFRGSDGFRVFIGFGGNTELRYTETQQGRLYLSYQQYVGPFLTWLHQEITPDDELDEEGEGKGAWDTPYAPAADNFSHLIAGYRDLYYSLDAGNNWGKFTIPGYDSTARIREIEWGNNNDQVFYFYISDSSPFTGHLWRCGTIYNAIFTNNFANANTFVFDLDSIIPGGVSASLTDLEENPDNANELWLTLGGYGSGSKVFYNPNTAGPAPWENISYNLPNVPAHCLEYDTDGLYVGTDLGVFFKYHGDTIWQYFSKDLPTVPVTKLEMAYFPWGRQLFCSTYGRGVWWSLPAAPQRRTRWYVDDTASGLNDGSSWDDAFIQLQTALDTVLPGDSIWVATGLYFPTSNQGFSLNEHNIYVWGGFAGTEDSVHQRDFVTNTTVLSGDIGVYGDSLDNAFHVLNLHGGNDGVLIDGFHIREGYADGGGENSKGAGIYFNSNGQTGKPVIRNCEIYHNISSGDGAGMYLADYRRNDPVMTISHCTFWDNEASGSAGAIYLDSSPNSLPANAGDVYLSLDSCVFLYNHGAGAGAIFAEAQYTGEVHITIDSAHFLGNSTTFNGRAGGIAMDLVQNGSASLQCNNVLFESMLSAQNAGAIYFDHEGDSLSAAFLDCTFEANSGSKGGAIRFYCPGKSFPSIFNNCTFINNTAANGGAVEYTIWGQNDVTADFSNCAFTGNTGTSFGGAIKFDADGAGWLDLVMDSCSFIDNTGGQGGAIYLVSGDNG